MRLPYAIREFEYSNFFTVYLIPLACGHILCEQCLESIQSEQCPFCREQYHTRHLKKLRVAPPPENDEGVMIQKFIMAWDDEVEVFNVLEEVDEWLERSEVSDHV